MPCGDDSSLYLFSHRAEGWRPALVYQADAFREVADALGSLRFVVSPPDGTGMRFVVVTELSPQCASNWQRLRYRVLRVGPTPETPAVLLEDEHAIYQGFLSFDLAASADGFSLGFTAEQGLDAGLHSRRHERHYRVRGNEVARIDPVAFDPREFVDEWVSSDWGTARSLSEPGNRRALGSWHGRLAELRGTVFTEFRSVEPCGGAEGCWRVVLACDPRERPEAAVAGTARPFDVVFTVARRGGVFRMTSIRQAPPPAP